MLGKLKLVLTLLIVPIFVSAPVYAINPVNSSSTHYSVNQVLFGFGGDNPTTGLESSPNYKSQVTLGETGIGNYTSPNYQAYAGFNTTDAPYIEAVVTSTNLDLGVLSKSTTATAISTFYVRSWKIGRAH